MSSILEEAPNAFSVNVDNEQREARAQQIYQIIISAAHNRQIITYKLLGKLIGIKGGGS